MVCTGHLGWYQGDLDTCSWSRAVLDHGALAGTLLVRPGTIDFALVLGLIKGCLGFF
jgi:hypothetical protein